MSAPPFRGAGITKPPTLAPSALVNACRTLLHRSGNSAASWIEFANSEKASIEIIRYDSLRFGPALHQTVDVRADAKAHFYDVLD